MITRRKMLSLLSVVAVLAVGAAGLLLLTSFKAEAEKTEVAAEARTVRTRLLVPGAQQVGITADGFLIPARSLDICSPVAGRVVMSRGGMKGGTTVAEGEIILALDDRRARLAFEQTRTEMIRSSSRFLTSAGMNDEERILWSDYLARLETAPHDSLPEIPGMDSRRSLLAVSMGVAGARVAMESAALDLSDHLIHAPFGGTLSGDGVFEGAHVSPGIPLAALMETGSLELPLSLPAEDIAMISVGDDVMVTRPGDEATLVGIVNRIEPILASGSQTARVHVVLRNPDEKMWIPGSFVRARIEGRSFGTAYRVPRSVLVDGRLPVFSGGKLKLLPVEILSQDDSDVLLAPDFPEGTELVETVLQTPIEGMPLRKEDE